MARVLTVLCLFVALLFACVVTWASTSSFFIARGSDATTFIHGVSVANRVISLICVAGVWIASVCMRDMSKRRRWGLRCAGWLVLGMATHLVVFNGRDGAVEEWWLLVHSERARFNVAEGLALDWVRSEWPFGVVLTHQQSGERSLVFTGVWPWRVDIEPSLDFVRTGR